MSSKAPHASTLSRTASRVESLEEIASIRARTTLNRLPTFSATSSIKATLPAARSASICARRACAISRCRDAS